VATFFNQYNDLLSVEALPPVVETSPLPARLVLPLLLRNGLKGETWGFEVAPIWEATSWMRLKGMYSFLRLDTRNKPTSIDLSTVGQTEGASPTNMLTLQSYLRLPGRIELDLTFRHVGELDNPAIPAYSTADARLGFSIREHLGFSIQGRNLFQPSHPEFAGNPGSVVGIRRSVYAQITFRN
jgi:iron complex outermembrane receptor protein